MPTLVKNYDYVKEHPYIDAIAIQYAGDLVRRFTQLKSLIWQSIVKNDCFRLRPGHIVAMAESLHPPFEFTENPQKVSMFMKWLNDAEDEGILEVTKREGRQVVAHSEWQSIYVRRSYEKGIAFAERKLTEAGISVAVEDIRDVFNRPIHADALGMLYTRNFSELQGITEAMDQQISRVLTDGLSQGKNPRVIARDIANRVDKIGITRARTLARTEVNRAQNEATLNRYSDYGVKKVEWVATSARACPICAANDGSIYTREEAHGLLPAHPNCYSDDTEVLTNHGWKLFKGLNPDDLIFSMNPKTLEMAYLPYKCKVQYNYEGYMYHLFSNSIDILATPDHQQIIGTRSDPFERTKLTWRIEPMKKVAKRGEFVIPRYGQWKGKAPVTVDINGVIIDTETFAKFMGYYLSEGSTTKRSEKCYQVQIAQKQPGLDHIYNQIKKLPVKWYKSNGYIGFNSVPLGKYLYQFGKSYEKCIPDEIKRLNSSLIEMFLNAYLEGDGSERSELPRWKDIASKAERQFFTSSNQMAADLGELILKAGGYPGYSFQKRKGKAIRHHNGVYAGNTDIWYVRWNRSKTSRFARSRQAGGNIEKVFYRGMVYDVELVDWHVLLVRRNGKTAWSGNCRCTWSPVV